MARVEVVSDEQEAQDIPVDHGESEERPRGEQRKRRTAAAPEVEVEREVTKRKLIESVTQIAVVILYMLFTLLRERDAGVVVLDDESSEDDWSE